MKRTLRSMIIVTIALLSNAHAQTPMVAFDYVSIDTMMALDDLERAGAELDRSRLGLSGSIDIDPSISYGGDVDEAAEFDTTVSSDLSLDYLYDSVAILTDEIDLLRAEDRLADRRRGDVEAALVAHSDVLLAMLGVDIEGNDLLRERDEFAEVQAEAEAGDATAAEVEDARIEFEDARLTLERAEQLLESALRNGERFGIGANPTFAILRFELPDAAPERTSTYRQLALELRRADALGLRNGLFGVLEDVTLSATYGTDDLNAGISAGLDRGRPGAGLDVGYDYPNDDTTASWEIELSLSLRIDDRTPSDFAGAERDLADARRDLELFLGEFSSDVIRERQDAEYAWEELQLARRQLDADRARIAELTEGIERLPSDVAQLRREADQVRADRDAATGDEREDLNDQVRDADDALRDAEGDLRDAERQLVSLDRTVRFSERTLYRQWIGYVRAVEDYLSVVDGEWAVAE